MAIIATILAINYQIFNMLPALSEPIALPPGAIVRLERVAQAAGDPVPERFLHFHGLAELVFIEEGRGTCHSEAGAIPFAPATAIVVPAMAIHDFAFEPGPRRWTLLQLDAQAADPDRSLLPPQATGVALEPRSHERIGMLLEWLTEIVVASPVADEIGVVLRSILLAVRMESGPAGRQAPAEPNPLARFRPYLKRAMNEPGCAISLSEAATLCRLSPPYFSRMFKETFGCGFSAYQNQARLQQAARLLATSREPVSQIGYRVGFHSHAYFSKCFKAMFGISPNGFQRTQRRRRADQAPGD